MNETATLPFSLLANLAVVLVEPRVPANIGSACRAMKNFGLSDLRLVHPPHDRNNDAGALAVKAQDVLEQARRVFTLDEALKDVGVVIGTTARLGGWRQRPLSVREAAGEILKLAQNNKVALLFGSEDRGLSNEQIRRCQMLITIPTSPDQTSLNLAQAVLLIGYELFLTQLPELPLPVERAPVLHVEAFYEEWAEALRLIDFLKPGNPDYWMGAFRRLYGRTGLSTNEVNILRGVCRQIRWVAKEAGIQSGVR